MPCLLPSISSVHPRVCGEQREHDITEVHYHGSSPRVRGTEPFILPRSARVRFIPACAGNSLSNRASLALLPVHPRVCGEQLSISLPDRVRAGSSPRVRGTVCEADWLSAIDRFIPACAGNSSASRWRDFVRSVHPRVCGEQSSKIKAHFPHAGSSPRVRGTAMAKGNFAD